MSDEITYKYGTRDKFVTAYNARLNKYHIGFITEDGRCRVDTHAGELLDDLTFWETDWVDPQNPCSGGNISRVRILGLRPDYT